MVVRGGEEGRGQQSDYQSRLLLLCYRRIPVDSTVKGWKFAQLESVFFIQVMKVRIKLNLSIKLS